MKNLNTILLYVADLQASAEFYNQLGFTVSGEDRSMIRATLGSITLTLLDQREAFFQQDTPREKGAGLFLEIETDDVNGCYEELIGKGLKPSGEPHDWPWGNREFAVKDPDGYRIVFWQKI